MAVATVPTVALVIAEAFRVAGQKNPSTDLTTRATDRWMQEIAVDIAASSGTHRLLQERTVLVTTEGVHRYALPSDFQELGPGGAVPLLDGPDADRGTLRAATATTATLASDDGGDEDGRVGRELLTTGGTGSAQTRQISAYNATTKVATVSAAWTTTPDATTPYLVVSHTPELIYRPLLSGIGAHDAQYPRGAPTECGIWDRAIWVRPVPDKSTYGLRVLYYMQLARLDLAGSRYLGLILEWENIWMAGLVVKVHKNNDDDRYQQSVATYMALLQALSAKQATISQVAYRDF
mgnify:CR=1 FL=1